MAIETDDSINANRGREDAYMTQKQLNQGMVQQCPCVMGHSWKGEIDAPTRITRPLKRVGGRGHGNGYFIEISWEEAIYTIATKIKETVEWNWWNSNMLMSDTSSASLIFSTQYRLRTSSPSHTRAAHPGSRRRPGCWTPRRARGW